MEKQKAKLYLNMILKEDEPSEMVKRSIESVASHVDGIYTTVTYKDKQPDDKSPIVKTLKSLGANISFFQWVDDFAAARTYALEQVPKGADCYFYWQDADDVLMNPEKIHELADEALSHKWAAIFLTYFYQVDLDESGNIREVIVEHKRERIIRNDGSFKWVNRLHEILVEEKQENMVKIARKECSVLHLSDNARTDDRIERNIRILEKQAEQELHRDPRTLVYLAKAYVDRAKTMQINGDKVGAKINFDLALNLFHEYLNGWGQPGTPGFTEGSGWPEERATAWAYVGEIAIMQGAPDIAIQAYQSAIDEAPQYPTYYVDLAMAYSIKGDFKKAKHWLSVATGISMPETSMIITPREMKTRALEIDVQVSIREGKFERAKEDIKNLMEILPGEAENLKGRLDIIDKMDKGNKAAQSIVYLGKYLEETKELDKLASLVKSIPSDLSQEQFASQMRHKFLPPRNWEKDEIAILCGPGFEEWSPKSLETGLGGSEEAVVYLSRELKKLGWKVTVYANPGKEAGDHDGVNYLPYYEININDNFNSLILWRAISFVDFKPKAKFTMVWMHDIPNNPDFTEERVNAVDKICVQSEYHKGLLRLNKNGTFVPMPENKVFLSSNGIPPLPLPTTKRDPQRIIYSSSADRGLVYLLKMWPEIKKAVPKASLHVYYGFQVFDVAHKDNPARMKWKEQILSMMKQPGITYHGRVGHQELAMEMSRSGVWAYPTDFDEISCITAMKCQAMGAVPVCTDRAALKETVRNGVKVSVDTSTEEGQEEFKNALIEVLKDKNLQKEIRDGMMAWARGNFGWDIVANNWDAVMRLKIQKNYAN